MVYRAKQEMPGYTFLDREFYNIAGSLHEALGEQEIKYAIVGGAAVQAYICHLITAGEPIRNQKIKTTLHNLLRKTSDIDVATLNATDKMFKVAERVAAGNMSFEFKENQKAIKFESPGKEGSLYVQYQLSEKDFKGLPKIYNDVVESAEKIELRYQKNNSINLYVARPEHIVASKLTRCDEKDIIDIAHLLGAIQNSRDKNFDFEDVRSMLKAHSKEKAYKTLERICLDLGIASPEI